MSETQRKRNAQVYLDWQLAKMMEMHPRLPAMAAGLVVAGELVYGGVRGVRRVGNPSLVKLSDRFHMGSITKPLTGYLMAVLCDRGKLAWLYSVRQTWPTMIDDLPAALGAVSGRDAWVAHYAGVRLWQLMTHSAGFAAGSPTQETEADLAALHSDPKRGLAAKRRRYTELALRDRPYGGWQVGDAGAQPRPYTGGCICAASMAETLTGRGWEQLLVEHVLMPLDMNGYTFGNASQFNAVTDIWHHRLNAGEVESSAFPFTNHGDYAHAPAGAVSLSVPSWALWMKALLKTGSDSHLSKARLDEYFDPPAPDFGYTRGGLQIRGRGFGHNGLNGWNYADMFIDRSLRMAALAVTNIGYEGVYEPVVTMLQELQAVGYAWPAMEHLSESLDLDELSISADSVPGQSAALVADMAFRTFWRSSTMTPSITISLDRERWLKGIALCQRNEALIRTFELELHDAASNATITTLKGASLNALTTRDGLVLKVLFSEPQRIKKLVLHVTSTFAPPEVTRLMVMTYEDASIRAFDITTSGRLWSIDHARRVRTTPQTLGDPCLAMDHDTLGQGSQVRSAAGKVWVIGDDGKLWRGEPSGWSTVTGSPQLLRIAVDATNDWVWCIADNGSIRKYMGSGWSVHPGDGFAKDITVHAGHAWVIGSTDQVFASTATGWTLMSNGPGPVRRLAVDRSSLTLWALVGDGRIYSRAAGASTWIEHGGGGRGKEIAVHAGVPYVIGSSNDGLWSSTGGGWQAIRVLVPRG